MNTAHPSDQIISYLSEEILNCVKESQLTQKEIGEKLGLTQAAVSHILTGKAQLTLSTFFELCTLLGLSPTELIDKAQNKILEKKILTSDEEEIIFKSPFHLLVFCLSIKKISKDFLVEEFPTSEIKQAIIDLKKSKLIIEKDGILFNEKSNFTFSPSTKYGNKLQHQRFFELIDHFQNKWMNQYENAKYRSMRFNSMNLEYLTDSQSKEILNLLYLTFSKITEYSKSNLARNYPSSDKYSIWAISLFASFIEDHSR